MKDWTNVHDSTSCEERIREIFDADLGRDRGVIHVTAVWAESGRSLITLAIGPETPRSETDTFLLNVARARADAILTTGKILREEPRVTHALQGPNDVPRALAAWRRHRMDRPDSPLSVVLTSGRDLDLGHPLFHGETRPLIFTTKEGAERLAPGAAGQGIEVVGHATPSLRHAIAYLRDVRGLETIVVEAGPSTSRGLYESPVRVDELMLSVYSEPRLPPSVRGRPFLSLQQLGIVFPVAGNIYRSEEESGRWVFRRYVR